MLQLLSELRHKVAIGFVGGSNLPKQQEQLGRSDVDVTTLFDFCFAENGLTAYRMGEELQSASFIKWLGEEKYKELVKLYVWLLQTYPRAICGCVTGDEGSFTDAPTI